MRVALNLYRSVQTWLFVPALILCLGGTGYAGSDANKNPEIFIVAKEDINSMPYSVGRINLKGKDVEAVKENEFTSSCACLSFSQSTKANEGQFKTTFFKVFLNTDRFGVHQSILASSRGQFQTAVAVHVVRAIEVHPSSIRWGKTDELSEKELSVSTPFPGIIPSLKLSNVPAGLKVRRVDKEGGATFFITRNDAMPLMEQMTLNYISPKGNFSKIMVSVASQD